MCLIRQTGLTVTWQRVPQARVRIADWFLSKQLSKQNIGTFAHTRTTPIEALTMIQRRLTVRVAIPSNEEVEYTPLLQHSHKAPSTSAPFLLERSINVPHIPKFESSSHLGEKLLGDVLVAFGVTLGVAPFISVVDKAIVQRANGSQSILSSTAESVRTMARNPIAFVKSPMFLMMWGVYGVTYATANSLKTITEHKDHERRRNESRRLLRDSTSSPSSEMTVFAGTTVVNSAVSLLKDKAYAKMFASSSSAPSSMPLITYGLFATRDLMVIGSSFILPELVGKKLEEKYLLDKNEALKISQLTVPIATQFFAAPVQLLGLDFYNRPLSGATFAEAAVERTRFLASGFWSVVGARVARIFPAYSIGGVFNTKFRDEWRGRLIQKEIRQLLDDSSQSPKQDMANRLVGLVAQQKERM